MLYYISKGGIFMKKNTYDVLADLLKGIGIISVVMGHSGLLFPANFSSSITAFLYLSYPSVQKVSSEIKYMNHR